MELVVQSHRAFNASLVDLQEQERTTRSLNGEIVSDSECELAPEVDSEKPMFANDVVRKKRIAIW